MAQTGKRPTIYSAAPAIPAPKPQPIEPRVKRIESEWQACHAERSRLAVRAKIGKDWDGKAANDNIAWPLAKALLAEGNKELLKYAIAYRRIYDAAKSEAVLGGKSIGAESVNMTYARYLYEEKESGEIKYGPVKKSVAAGVAIPPKQKRATDSLESGGSTSSVPKPWNGDASVNDMIDAKVKLEALDAKLGVLREPLELAIIDNKTLQEIGNSAGIANRAGAMGAGRVLVHMGLVTVRDSLGKLDRKDFAA